MSDRPIKGIHYLNMGPWPGFIGFVFEERAFKAELKRLDIRVDVQMLGHERAHATLHHFVGPRDQGIYLLALGSTKGRTKEQIAGLIAHEAMHIIQYMQKELARGESLGDEAEAYLIQMIVQEALQILWKSNMVRCKVPSK